jgi:nucleoside-diphosphate-sugar epimerase
MRVLVAGATGAIGRPLVARLRGAGHQVVGMTRRAERAADLERQGATAVVCDVLDRPRLMAAVEGCRPDAVLHQLTAIPKRIDPRQVDQALAATNRLRGEGTHNLLDAARAAGARRFLAQSVAFAYAPGGAGLRREEDPLFAEPPAKFRAALAAVRELETATLAAADLGGIVLRYGYFYGPGTVYARDGSFAEDVLRRRVPLVGDGAGVFSFVHVEDAAAATVAALERGQPGVYNVVDDEPAAARDWLPFYAGLLGAKPPMRVPRLVARLLAGAYVVHVMCAQPGASNTLARARLGFKPTRPTWRDGFREVLAG